MNTHDPGSPQDQPGSETAGADVWLVRADRAQKAFIARTLEWAEDGDSSLDGANLAIRAAALEAQARDLQLTHVGSMLESLGRFLLVARPASMSLQQSSQALPALPAVASKALSLLLLRVYLTGTDTGGAAEVEHLERSLVSYLGAQSSKTTRSSEHYN
jgi:hypothetical protein